MSRSAVIDRVLYEALDKHVYLNQASLGLIPRPSIDAMTSFLVEVAQFGNVRLSDAAEANVLHQLRQAASELLDAPLHSIAITSGASEGLAQLAATLAPRVEEVILVPTDFPSVTYPWLTARERLGTRVRWVEDSPATDLTDALVNGLSGRAAVVCVSAVQYATGSAVDVQALCSAAHDAGARVVVDASQLAGAGPVSMREWRADALVSSGYKWLSAHGGVALLAVADELLETTPYIVGWMGTESPFDFDATNLRFRADARRYQLSTMSYSSVVGLGASLSLLAETGISTLAAHSRELAGELVARAEPLGWSPFRSLNDPCASSHIVCLRHPTISARAAQAVLAANQSVHLSARGDGLRVSLHGYNDSGDIEVLIDGLAAQLESSATHHLLGLHRGA